MKDPLITLPIEVFFQILLLLDPVSICLCCRVSKAWRSLFESDRLWQVVAIHLGYDAAPCYISSDGSKRMTAIAATLEQHPISTHSDDHQDTTTFQKTLDRYRQASATGYFDDCDSFKKLCCKLWMLECNWSGRNTYETRTDWEASRRDSMLPVTLKPKIRSRRNLEICDFKLDPVERTIIATGFRRGLTVFDKDTFQVLWRIFHTKSRLHLEFSNGYMAFNGTRRGDLEVYQSERTVVDVGKLQQPPRRGHFCFLKYISLDKPIPAFRLQYPYLAAISADSTISFFELPSGRLTHKFSFRNSPHRRGNVNHIDFDDEYFFLAGTGAHAASVFSRETGEMVWNLGQYFASGHAGPLTWFPSNRQKPAFADRIPFVRRTLKKVTPSCWQGYPHWHKDWAEPPDDVESYQAWYAIQPDVKTRTLCILGQGTLVMLRDYKAFFRDTSSKPDIFAEIEFRDITEHVTYQWDPFENEPPFHGEFPLDAQLTVHDGKAFVVNGAPIIVDLENPGPTCGSEDRDRQNQQDETNSDSQPTEPCPFTFYDHPKPFICNEKSPPYVNAFCSCVQMDQTGVYYVDVGPVVIDQDNGYMNRERVIQHVDFTQTNQVLLRQIRESLHCQIPLDVQEASAREKPEHEYTIVYA